MKKISYNVSNIKVNEDGVIDFYYPIGPDEIFVFYKKVRASAISFIRKLGSDHPSYDVIRILYPSMIIEIMSLLEAYIISDRSNKDKISIVDFGKNFWLENISPSKINNITLPTLLLLRKSPCKKTSKVRSVMRAFRDVLVSFNEGIIRRPIKKPNVESDIFSITINPLTIVCAKKSKKRILYKRLEFFFNMIVESKIRSQNSSHEVIDSFLDKINSSIDNALPCYIVKFIKSQMASSAQLVNEYLSQLDLKDDMPKYLYVGTSGQLWGRILARYIRRKGGDVTRFDHGSGNGFCDNPFVSCIHELEDCDYFYTFKDSDRNTQLKTFDNKYIVQSTPPIIMAPYNDLYSFEIPPVRKSKKVIIKIMYVAAIYSNGWFHSAQHRYLRNTVFLDWQVRLMSRLKRWGFDVIFKPHPVENICSKPPESIQKATGCTALNPNVKVEGIYDTVDLIIFDSPLSSYFDSLVSSGIPAIFIDFGHTDFNETVRGRLMDRFNFIKGFYNGNNRADINWLQLKNAVNSHHPDIF